MNEFLALLIRANLVASGAVLAVLVLRHPVRRLFGARVAYGLWALVPLAGAAMLLPARVVRVSAPNVPTSGQPIQTMAATASGPIIAPGCDPTLILLALWLVGVAAGLVWLAWRQGQFSGAVRRGIAGPAVVGVLRPRIVTPDDFTERFTDREQQVVLAHERAHIARQDSRINGLVALARCLAWFNPLAHLMGRLLRIDQELACDAQVVAAHPTARRAYAEAMLKAQLAAQPLPLGCYWPAASAHPLAERIRLLAEPAPDRVCRRVGGGFVALAALASAGAVWASRPEEVVLVPGQAPQAAQASTPAPTPAKLLVSAAAAPQPAEPADQTQPPASPPTDLAATPVSPAATPTLIQAAVTMIDRPMPSWFDPNHRFVTVARRSSVAPGFAVRVLAEMTDPQGVELTTDMTAYGSQSRFRTGWYWNKGSRYELFTSVVQQGDRYLVSASLDKRFRPGTSGSILLADGQIGEIVLANGLKVRVRPTVRAETPDEIAAGRSVMGRL
jgi:beta-lactamase regulating signal transducer with metallopeptidase domain